MCGIFGVFSQREIERKDVNILAAGAETRGQDSSGLVSISHNDVSISRGYTKISHRLNKFNLNGVKGLAGHGRLITNGDTDNQPVYSHGVITIHNGIVVNDAELWSKTKLERHLTIDTEIICALVREHVDRHGAINNIGKVLHTSLSGAASILCIVPDIDVIFCWSNTGDMYVEEDGDTFRVASDKSFLAPNTKKIKNIKFNEYIIGNKFELNSKNINISDENPPSQGIPQRAVNLNLESNLYKKLEFNPYRGQRCSKCVLPETMPFIKFNNLGVCNYCENYTPRNNPKSFYDLEALVSPYRRTNQEDCIIPFSGGRDSCYSLHIAMTELGLNCVTYTYDWGMVTDLGRRNISRMTSSLGVRNIVIAANIEQKRKNIKNNLIAWLNNPHLGMVSILTAGDKHFFKYIDNVKKSTGVELNLWGINPLEITHFKSGFLGLAPNFMEKSVYNSSGLKQLNYQYLRLKQMFKSPGYFNSSLWDTISGEFYRTYHKKSNYFHVFDYLRWDEEEIDDILINKYDWELAPDTTCTWRIGDGTAAFYNYIYYTVAGFSEHDTFRSNQIREGDISRSEALELLSVENLPRGPNLKWYLDSIGMDFDSVITGVNNIPKIRKDI